MIVNPGTKRILEPGLHGKDEEVSNCCQRNECGVGYFELLVKFLRLLVGQAGQTLSLSDDWSGFHTGFGLLSGGKFLFGHEMGLR